MPTEDLIISRRPPRPPDLVTPRHQLGVIALGIENQDHLGAVEKLGVNVESRSAGTENAVASAPRSKKRQKRRIAPTLVSGNAQAPPVRSKVAIVKEPLKIGALSVQEIDHSLGSLCVFVAASLARCLPSM